MPEVGSFSASYRFSEKEENEANMLSDREMRHEGDSEKERERERRQGKQLCWSPMGLLFLVPVFGDAIYRLLVP